MIAKKSEDKHDDGVRTYTADGRKHWAEVNSKAYVTRSDGTGDLREGGRPEAGDRDPSSVSGSAATT